MRTPAKGDYRHHATTGLQQRCKNLERKVEALENGEALRKARAEADCWKGRFQREAGARRRDAARAVEDQKKAVRIWQQAAADVDAENGKLRELLAERDAEIARLRKESEEKDGTIRDLAEQVAALKERLGLDHTNSGTPTSKDPVGTPSGKKRHDHNSRVRSGRKQGAQPGHPHHGRPGPTPTEPPVIHNTRPAWMGDDPDWEETGEHIEKRLVSLVLRVLVTPHRIMIWRNRRTGGTAPSVCPEGVADDMSYDETVKAAVLMLRQHGNVAVRRVKQLLFDLPDGAIDLSTGFISERGHELSVKGRPEMDEIFRSLHRARHVHVDTTVTKNEGEREAVTVVRSGDAVLCSHTKHKGKEAVDPLPCAPQLGYEGDVTGDREAAFLPLGKDHQDCLEHYKRDLMRVAEMEPDKTWAVEMPDLFREILVARRDWGEDGPSPEQVAEWRGEHRGIVDLGLLQHGKRPASKHWMFGDNLVHTLDRREKNALLLLEKPWMPGTNNLAEQSVKVHKRALAAATTFRSDRGVDDHCDGLSMRQTWMMRGESAHGRLKEILARNVPTRAH